jgi:hypothetical protein
LFKNKFSKRVRRAKRRFRKGAKNTTRYMYSRALQTMGVGTTKVRVTRFYSYLPATIGTSQDFVSEIVRDSVASQEFNRFAQDYNYAKLKRITVTSVPTAANSQAPVFFKMDWINGEGESVIFDDNAKLVWNNTNKPITYKFKPPNILLNNLDTDKPIKINYTEWQDSKTIVAENIPGYVKVTTSITTKLIMEVVWVFRGYNAKYPYTTKEIVNNKGVDSQKNDEILGIIRDLKEIAMIEDDKEEKKEKRKEWEDKVKERAKKREEKKRKKQESKERRKKKVESEEEDDESEKVEDEKEEKEKEKSQF